MENENRAARKRELTDVYLNMSRSKLQRLLKQAGQTQPSSDSSTEESEDADDRISEEADNSSSEEERPAPIMHELQLEKIASDEDESNSNSEESDNTSDAESSNAAPEHQLPEIEALAQALEDVSDSDTNGEVSSEEGEEREEEVNPPIDPRRDQQLHAQTDITTGEYVLLLLELYMKNRLTKSCLADILFVINVALPQPNNLPKTKYKILKFLEGFVGEFVYRRHRFCENVKCYSYVGEWEETENTENCPDCGHNKLDGLFVENSIESIIKHCFEQRKLYRHFQNNEFGLVDGYICDITGGAKYRDANIGRGLFDVTFLWNTDGVPVFKSSNAQLWPLLLTICELDPTKRKENVLVAGLWFGSCKPSMNTYTRPFVDSLRNIHETGGVEWKHPETGERVRSKVIAPVCSVDAIARAPLQNISQFNGKYGCSGCEHPGEGFPRVYPFKTTAPRPRENGRMNMQAVLAARTGSRIKGVKGLSYTSLIPHFDLATSFVPEYMHGALLGATRQMLNLWLDSSSHLEPWYIGLKSKDIDTKILKILPPNDINRVPRSVVRRPHWKASEYRNWLLFYSCICLSEILPAAYLEHWVCYVGAMYLLLQQRISQTDIALASALLKSFVARMEDLYGISQNKYNIHQHLHFAESVRNWGPLWATALFSFENENGQLLRLIHGTQEVAEQLIGTNKLMVAVQVLRNKYVQNHHEEVQGEDGEVSGSLLGKPITNNIPIAVRHEIGNFLRLNEPPNSSVYIHSQLAIKGQGVITSVMYSREKKRNSYTVAFTENHEQNYGEILCFVRYEHSGVFCLVKRLLVSNENPKFVDSVSQFTLRHLIHIVEGDDIVHVPPRNILRKVVRAHDYVCLQPNDVEKNL